jgi:hypothetical protein
MGGLLIPCSPPISHPTHQKKLFPSVILSVMLFTPDIKIELNPFSANNVETHYNWLPLGDSGSERVNPICVNNGKTHYNCLP